MEQTWKAEERCLGSPSLVACVRIFSLSISATKFPFDLSIVMVELSMACTHLKQPSFPCEHLRITSSANILKHLPYARDMIEVMILHSSVYRTSVCKLKMEGSWKVCEQSIPIKPFLLRMVPSKPAVPGETPPPN